MKFLLKQKALALRKAGYSYGYIGQRLEIPKATLSDWLSKISYTPNRETITKIGNARVASARKKRTQKLQSLKNAYLWAKRDIGLLKKRDLFMLGIGLYIGEGSKTGNLVRIVNSDPKIIRMAIRWLKNTVGLKDKNFAMRVHLYPDNNKSTSLRFWSRETSIPLSQFQKTSIDNRSGKKQNKKGKLPYGTAHLTVKSNGRKEFGVFLSRRISAWMEIVLR